MTAVSLDERSERAGLQRLVQELAPGGRLVRTQRFRGGLGSVMYRLVIDDAAGARRSAVLRRYLSRSDATPQQLASRELRLLRLLEEAGVPAPRLLLADLEGTHFGTPCLVLSYVPGRAFLAPFSRPAIESRRMAGWTDELARGLALVHGVTPGRFDLAWLPDMLSGGMAGEIEHLRDRLDGVGPLGHQGLEAAQSMLSDADWLEPCLVHGDFWPGNTVWYRNRLVAVIDWTEAHLGDPRFDLSQCRADLIVSHDIEVADAFLASYERQTGRTLTGMRVFDLLLGLRALVHYRTWLRGYHDAGLTHLTAEAVGDRLRAFLRQTLASS